MHPGMPEKQGLYDPRFEHDSCGVGFVVDMFGRKSNAIVRKALQVWVKLKWNGEEEAGSDLLQPSSWKCVRPAIEQPVNAW